MKIFVISTPPPEASLEYTHEHMFDVVDVMSNLPSATYMWQIVNPAVAIWRATVLLTPVSATSPHSI